MKRMFKKPNVPACVWTGVKTVCFFGPLSVLLCNSCVWAKDFLCFTLRLHSWRLRIILSLRASEAAMTMSCTAWPSYKGESSCLAGFTASLCSWEYIKLYSSLWKCVMMRYIWSKTKVCVCESWAKYYKDMWATVTWRLKSCPECSAQTAHRALMISHCCWSLRLSPLISWWPYMVSVCMPSFKHRCGSQIRGFNKSTGKAITEGRGRKERGGGGGGEGEGCIKCSSPVLLCCCGWWRAEKSREQSLSEVTHGWMFIFRAPNYLTTALTVCVCACPWVCVSLCVTISARVREMWPAVPYIPQSSPRGQCVQRDWSWKDEDWPSRIERRM